VNLQDARCNNKENHFVFLYFEVNVLVFKAGANDNAIHARGGSKTHCWII